MPPVIGHIRLAPLANIPSHWLTCNLRCRPRIARIISINTADADNSQCKTYPQHCLIFDSFEERADLELIIQFRGRMHCSQKAVQRNVPVPKGLKHSFRLPV
jgi:hypothetical protein